MSLISGHSNTGNTNFANDNTGIIGDNNTIVTAQQYDGPFYAYVHNIQDDNTWRVVITFASRDVADEWWRAIESATNQSGQSLEIKRVNPQFYTHDPNRRWNVLNFFTDSYVKKISEPFRGKMFLTLENDRGGRGIRLIEQQTIVDHTSGSWFSVRSKSDPTKHWFFDPATQRIVVSDTQRTSFKVSGPALRNGQIMIGPDDMNLMTEGGATVSSANLPGAPAGPTSRFGFADLKLGRFFAGLGNSSAVSYSPSPGPRGWELAL